MKCNPDLAEVLVQIIEIGLMRIRSFGSSGDARRCVFEADHIHNLPRLLNDYSPELLAFYWTTERPLLIRQISEPECAGFFEAWQRLEKLIESERALSTPSQSLIAPSVAVAVPSTR